MLATHLRSIEIDETAERWTRGEANLAEVRAAAYGAYVYATRVVHNARVAADFAAAKAAARTAALAQMATRVRKRIPWSACLAARKGNTDDG